MDNTISFQNKSIYFLPLSFEDYAWFTREIEAMPHWRRIDGKELSPSYLFSYASEIAEDTQRFSCFQWAGSELTELKIPGDEDVVKEIQIQKIRLSCFSTGVGFLEFWVSYGALPIERIIDFVYAFKRASGWLSEEERQAGKETLLSFSRKIIPQNENIHIFFNHPENEKSRFKYDCNIFHMIEFEKGTSQETIEQTIKYLRRNYGSAFLVDELQDSNYDLFYKAYSYDQWGGSQEGIVNIFTKTDYPITNSYLTKRKPSQLETDFLFMYLLLLNQRYTSIYYILKETKNIGSESERLGKQIAELKTKFSFRVISDDLNYQNIYAKMYELLDLKGLLEDLEDYESQLLQERNIQAEKTERLTSKFLFGISLLSLFSALIDAATYFDRIPKLSGISTLLSLAVTVAIIIVCAVWMIKRKK